MLGKYVPYFMFGKPKSDNKSVHDRYREAMVKKSNPIRARTILGTSVIFALTSIAYVFWMKGADWKLSYRGVERDVARQRKKLGLDDDKAIPQLKDV